MTIADRIKYIDYFKAIAMILVIMGHVNFANQGVKAWIYSFHMPAFFFATGMVLKVGGAFSFKDTLLNKLHRLMLPYLLWALFYAKFSVPNFLKIVYGSYWSVSSSGSSSNLWFLPVMFMSLIFFYLYVKTGLANNILSNLLAIILSFFIGSFLPHLKIGYPWGTDVAFMAFAFMMLGFVVNKYFDKLYQCFKSTQGKGTLCSFIVFFVMLIGTLTYQLNDSVGAVMMKNAHYGDSVLFAITAIFGILMLLFLSVLLEFLNLRGSKFLSFLGQNTLLVFVVHKPIIGCFNVLFSYINIPVYFMLLLTTLFTMLLSCLMCIFINKYAPILAGR